MIECSKRSDLDKDISFHRIPSVTKYYGEREYELWKKRQDGYLAAISRQDIEGHLLENYRICSRHFFCGEPAGLYNVDNIVWLPTLHPGHLKKNVDQSVVLDRWERAILLQIKDIIADEVVLETTELVIKEEVHAIANKRLNSSKNFCHLLNNGQMKLQD